MKEQTNKYLIVALISGLLFHGSAMFFTLENTYDALIHMFFGNHYAESWFEPWNYKWYTGFTVMGYPPLVHQTIGLLSLIGGLKFGLFSVTLIAITLYITGAYRFGLLITGNKKAAGYAALLAAFSSTFIETLHLFGQLPSIIGISVLLHTLPEIYLWVKVGKYKYLLRALSLLAVTVTSHHVTPIFGMVFFILPLLGMTVMDVATEKVGGIKKVRLKAFVYAFFSLLKRMIVFGVGAIALIIVCILPYWINSKNNPITQVPIPHGSRDNFLEVTSSGLVFFVIPWGILLLLWPYLFYRFYAKRYLFFGLSFTMLAILGTGGTTPIPIKILGENAFNILTLDRFTLWASIMSLPIFGEFAYRLAEGDLKLKIQEKLGAVYHRILGGLLVTLFIFMSIFTISLGYFRPMQPDKIDMLPIVNFLNQDQHDQWRFLPLGFGDQMAWLSSQTNAMTVDGNYHSARRLPELTTRAVERLENSKFRGIEGIGSLQQFLAVPEKYNLKYVFSNDKFYDPMLYFSGWQRLQQLENGITVWERLNVAPLSKIIPKDDVAIWLKLMWGIIPLLTVLIAFVVNIQIIWYQALKIHLPKQPDFIKFSISYQHFSSKLIWINQVWALLVMVCVGYGIYLFYLKNATQISPKNVITAYYDALDFKAFERAHSYLNPNEKKTLSQFMLETSVTDGMLSSYAKLDAMDITVNRHKNEATAIVTNTYITPLEVYKKTFTHTLKKQKGKWFITPNTLDTDIPPDQLIAYNTTQFYNHGRRRITTQQTHHEDILKQTVLEVLSAKLIKKEGKYSIIGEIQNVDNLPADVTVKGTLYNKQNVQLATYNAQYQIKHKLMPKEITSFKIDFEGVAWLKKDEKIPETFNPYEFTSVELKGDPVQFDLQCAGNIATTDLYKNVSINQVAVHKSDVNGTLFNFSIEEVTIPQLIISYYNKQKELIWVNHQFMEEGVRIQRKQNFSLTLEHLDDVDVIQTTLKTAFVNGLPNAEIAKKMIPNRQHDLNGNTLISVDNPNYSYIKIELNNFIGNPH